MRRAPALVTQREFKQAHGDQIAADLDLNKIGFPILNHRDGIFWICDGQHRVYALLKYFDAKDHIDCEVYEGLTDPQMAEIFLGRDARRRISPFDKFHVACTAGRKRENDVRRAVESNGLKIGRGKDDHTIGAVGALLKVYDRSGDVVLGQTLRALNEGFAGDPSAFAPELIDGVGLVFNRYNGKTDERILAARLAAFRNGVRALGQRAQTLRMKTGNERSQCVAATIVEVYNRGLAGSHRGRLLDWWKANDQAADAKAD